MHFMQGRLAERDRQLQQQGQQILDLSWRAKVAEDWTEWWEHRRHEFPVHSRPSTRTVRQPPSPSTERRSRSRSASTSVTRQTGRSVTPRRDTRRSVTPTRRGREGRGPLNNLEEETLQEVEEFEEQLLESLENFPEPVSQATMVCVNGYGRDDLEPHKPWASRLDHTELVEMARRQRREVIQDYPRKPCKDGWMGPVPFEARDNEATLLHNFRWWFFHCKKGSMPPFRYDGAIDQWRKTVLAFSGDRVYIMQRDDPMSTPVPRLSSYEGVEVMIVARPLRGEEGMGAAAVGKGRPRSPKGERSTS